MAEGLFFLRLFLGVLLFAHGTQKLFGWFGGHGLDGTGGFFESLGLRPGKRNAIAAGVAEAGGGALLAAGVATPLAGAAITGTMVTAIRHVHWPKGPWVTDGGWEYNAVLAAAVLAAVEERSGPAGALFALGAGTAGSLAASYLAQQQTAPEPEGAAGVPFQRAPEPVPAEDTVPAS